MFKFTIAIIFAFIACAAAKPGLLLGQSVAYSAPLVAAAPAPYVTATSSQVFARNYNGIAAAPVIAPVAAPVLARYAAAPLAAPLAYHAAPLAYSHPVAAPVLL